MKPKKPVARPKKKPARAVKQAKKKNSAKPSRNIRKKTPKNTGNIPAKPPVDPELAGLPGKQQVFIAEYLANGFNATNAAKAAGYSAATADSQGSRLLKNAKVAAIIRERTGKSLAKRELTAERVLDEITKLAFFDPRRLFDLNGNLVPIRYLGDDEAAAIAGLDVRDAKDGSQLKKIRLSDKTKSLEMLGRYFRLFTERVEHSGVLGVQLIHDVPRPQRKKD